MKHLLVVLTAVLTLPAVAQQRPVVSLYMLNGLALNPAYAGRHEYTSFTAVYRDQWINVPGSPKLIAASAQTGFKSTNMGVGLQVAQDVIGVHDNTSVYASYAYNLRTGRTSKLSLGLQAGFDNLKSDYDETTKADANDPYLTGSVAEFMPNFGAGLLYHSEHGYFGLSVPYILSNKKFKFNGFYSNVKLARYYYATAGKIIEASPRLVIKPSALIRVQDGGPLTFDLNANFYIDEFIGLGASYRYKDSVIGIFEFWMNKYLKFSYAYDYTLSSLTSYTRGTHELMLNYRVNFSAPRKHRSCPGPMYF